MSLRQKPFAKDSPTCPLAKNHSPNIRQRFANVSVRQNPIAKDSPCQFAEQQSPKIHQRVSSPKRIPQRFANDSSTCQFAKQTPQRFATDSPTCEFAKNHSPKIRQRFANVSLRQKTFPKDSPMIRQRVSSPKTIPQRFAKDSPTCQFAKNHSPKIRQ